jgi:hypothetical protein
MTLVQNRAEIAFAELNPSVAASSHKHGGDTLVAIPDGGLMGVTGEVIDPARQGGLFVIDGVAVTLRHPDWRTRKGDTNTRTGDFMYMPGVDGTPDPGNLPYVGVENEGFFVDERTRTTVDVSDAHDPHPELFRHMKERASEPVRSLFDVGIQTYEGYRAHWTDAEEVGALFYPGSNVAHKRSTLADLHPNEYVVRIANHMGGEEGAARTVLYYDVASFQATIGNTVPYPALAATINLFQATISPLFAKYTAASFAARGSTRPSFPEPYGHLNPSGGWDTTRSVGRRAGSPEGGILEPMPLDIEGFKRLGHQRMRDGLSPGAGRITGLHPDVRFRPEHGPAGAAEFCSMDTNGGHIESNMAITAMLRAYVHVVGSAYQSGRIQELARRYPTIMATHVDIADFAASEANSMLLAQDIPGLKISTVNGQEHSPAALWSETIRMLAAETKGTPYELNKTMQQWLLLRAQTPDPKTMPRDKGLVDIGAFYRGGPGTLSQYQRVLCEELRQLGFNESQAIAEVEIRTAKAHREYIRRFNPNRDLAFLRG